jgi:hypothetical protein
MISSWPLPHRCQLFYPQAVFCFSCAWLCLFWHRRCGGASVVIWSVDCLRAEFCLPKFSFYLCLISLSPFGAVFRFWWVRRSLLIWDRELVPSATFWAGLVSSLVVWKLRGVFLIMGVRRWTSIKWCLFWCLFSVFHIYMAPLLGSSFLAFFVRLMQRPV